MRKLELQKVTLNMFTGNSQNCSARRNMTTRTLGRSNCVSPRMLFTIPKMGRFPDSIWGRGQLVPGVGGQTCNRRAAGCGQPLCQVLGKRALVLGYNVMG